MYLLLVVSGVVIGYVTKLVAIQMLFRPPRFIGIRPVLGWQGVVPRNADRVARVNAELLATRLLEPRDIFARIDPAALAAQVEQPLLAAIDEIVRDVLREHHPRLWEMLPILAQDLIVKQVQAAAPRMVDQLVTELRAEVGSALDARALVTAFQRDAELVPQMVRRLSKPEMAFVARCGLWLGLVCGAAQAVVWRLTGVVWVLPVCGAVIGGLTNWLALRLVFFPRAPRRLVGVPVQGAFQRRRERVAVRYGEVVGGQVITVPALVDAVLQGPRASRLAAVVARIVDEVVDEQLRVAGPARALAVAPVRLPEMKEAATAAAISRLPGVVRHAEAYLTTAMDLPRTITARVRKLNRVEYEALLRPAFRSYTWPVLITGALLGALAGTIPTLLLP